MKRLFTTARATAFAFALAIAVAGDEPPSEFRLFVKGWNDTTKGRFLFDDDAAKEVMAAYAAHQVDRMIDLEHLSLDPESKSFDPDARGWCRLEVRDDGSLWAVNVTWTDDGAERLRAKKQRYISPAFDIDPKTKRVTKIINIALTALPATHGTPELVAASARDRRKLSAGPSLGDVSRAVSAALADIYPPPADNAPCLGPWVVDVFDASVVYEYDGRLFEVSYALEGSAVKLGTPVEVQRTYAPAAAAAPTPAPAPTPQQTTRRQKLSAGGPPMFDAKTVQEALDALTSGDSEKASEILKRLLAAAASGTTPAAPDAGAAANANAPPPEEDKDKEPAMAAARVALSLTGKTDIGEAMAELSRRSKLAVEFESKEKALAADREKLETTERRKLVGELVRVGAEIPATAWSDDKGTVPCDRLAKEPISELRTRVQQLSQGRPPPQSILPPRSGGDGDAGGQLVETPLGPVTLSAREVAMCAEMKVEVSTYAAQKASKKKG